MQGLVVLPVAGYPGLLCPRDPQYLDHSSCSAHAYLTAYYALIFSIMQALKNHFVLDSCLEGCCGLTANPKPSFRGKERKDEKDPLLLQPSAIL